MNLLEKLLTILIAVILACILVTFVIDALCFTKLVIEELVDRRHVRKLRKESSQGGKDE